MPDYKQADELVPDDVWVDRGSVGPTAGRTLRVIQVEPHAIKNIVTVISRDVLTDFEHLKTFSSYTHVSLADLPAPAAPARSSSGMQHSGRVQRYRGR